jgi:hypothetical protein
MEQVEDVVAVSDLEPPAKPSETGLLLVRLSMEEYAERLNALGRTATARFGRGDRPT